MSDPDAQWGLNGPEPETPLREPDIPSLLAFAAASRGQAWADRLVPTQSAAAAAGWSKTRWAAEACRLILAEDGDPQQITDATRNPLARHNPGDGPPPEWYEAKAALGLGRAAL